MLDKLKNASQNYSCGCTCSQAVFCAYAKDMGIDKEAAYRIMEGFGCVNADEEVCVALSVASALISYYCSDGNALNRQSKELTCNKVHEAAKIFKQVYEGTNCKEILKGKMPQDMGCGMKVKDTVLMIEKVLEGVKSNVEKKLFSFLVIVCCFAALTGCGNTKYTASSAHGESVITPSESSQPKSSKNQTTKSTSEKHLQNDLGAMKPEETLDYMKKTDNLVIVDVAAERWYEEEHFEGAINIPIESLDSEDEDALYMDISSDRPVLLHCRRGMIVPGAYKRVKELCLVFMR